MTENVSAVGIAGGKTVAEGNGSGKMIVGGYFALGAAVIAGDEVAAWGAGLIRAAPRPTGVALTPVATAGG